MEKLIMVFAAAFSFGCLGWFVFFKASESQNLLFKTVFGFSGFIMVLISLSTVATIIASFIKFFLGDV